METLVFEQPSLGEQYLPKLLGLFTLIRKFFYADDIDFLTHTVDDMQHIVNVFVTSCTAFGLKNKLHKNKNNSELYIKLIVTVHDASLAVVGILSYLGCTLTNDGSLNAKNHICIQKASVAYEILEKHVRTNYNITHKTKINVYRSCMLSLLY